MIWTIAVNGFVSSGVKKPASPSALGRPREFDPNKALNRAMLVFWQKGYRGASVADLTKAMAINRPSLYAAFGNKRTLFLKSLEHFADGPTAFLKEALKETTSREVVRHMLTAAVEMATAVRNPPGCLWVKGALTSQDRLDSFRQEFFRQRIEGELRLQRRLEQAIATGDLPANVDAAALARFIEAVRCGMAVQAATGASRQDLLAVVETVLSSWPTDKPRNGSAP